MRHEYCEKDGILITYNDDNVAFEDTCSAEAIVIDNTGKIILNNFDASRTEFFLNWFHKIYDTITYFRSLDRLEVVS